MFIRDNSNISKANMIATALKNVKINLIKLNMNGNKQNYLIIKQILK